jgi:hypothetical protein
VNEPVAPVIPREADKYVNEPVAPVIPCEADKYVKDPVAPVIPLEADKYVNDPVEPVIPPFADIKPPNVIVPDAVISLDVMLTVAVPIVSILLTLKS